MKEENIMQVKKIAFFEMDQQRTEFFKRNLSEYQLDFYTENLGEQHLPEILDCQIIFVANYSPVNRAIVEKLKETKLIVTGATGFNNIDVKACADAGIMVANTPGYSDDTIAEYALTLMLMSIRNAHLGFVRARENNFSWDGLMGHTLKGKTLGIIGTGKIGMKVIELAKGFGMKVIAYDIYENQSKAAELGFTYDSLEKVLSNSDIVSLHLTANKSTYHFINQDRLKLCKKGSILINTSRGEVLDTKALIWALDNNILACAALDVLEEERLCQENNLLKPDITGDMVERYALNQHLMHREDVLITPHIGWCTVEAIENMMNINLANIVSFINGEPINIVSKR
jgi:D-lactate dehydrogenase